MASYIRSTPAPPPPTTTTTTEVPVDDDDDADALWWATSSTDSTTRTPFTIATRRPTVAPAAITTNKPKRRQWKKPERESLADWRNRFYGTWAGTSPAPKRPPTTSTSSTTTIEEGSYYDRTGTAAKIIDQTSSTPFFRWDKTTVQPTSERAHSHRHRHGEDKRLNRGENEKQEFESRSTVVTTTERPGYASTWMPYGKYIRPSTVDPMNTKGSVWYHNRKDKEPITHRRTSESVTFVAGSYFPHSSRLRKQPLSSYFNSPNDKIETAESYPTATTTVKPQTIQYPTRSIKIKYFPGARYYSNRRISFDDGDYEDVDDNVHPFASSGK